MLKFDMSVLFLIFFNPSCVARKKEKKKKRKKQKPEFSPQDL